MTITIPPNIEAGNSLAERVDAAAFQRWLLLFLLAGAFLMLSSVRLAEKYCCSWSGALVRSFGISWMNVRDTSCFFGVWGS